MTRTQTNTQSHIRLANCIAISMVLTLFALYVYYLSASVVHVVIRKEIMHDIAKTQSEISSLESTYIAHKYEISEQLAENDQFTTVSDKVFLTRRDSNLVLSR